MKLLKIGKSRIVNLDYLVEAKKIGDDLHLFFSAPDYRLINETEMSDGVPAPQSYKVAVKANNGAEAIWEYLERMTAVVGAVMEGGIK